MRDVSAVKIRILGALFPRSMFPGPFAPTFPNILVWKPGFFALRFHPSIHPDQGMDGRFIAVDIGNVLFEHLLHWKRGVAVDDFVTFPVLFSRVE